VSGPELDRPVDLATERSPGVSSARCALCGRATYDPSKKERPWSRGVAAGRQVLVCPTCQVDRPDWAAGLDRCQRCGSTRLSLMLGEVICRACGQVAGGTEADQPFTEWGA
jgi:hypothetical protein